jgi:GNAT superfamily N-acetyltransferase
MIGQSDQTDVAIVDAAEVDSGELSAFYTEWFGPEVAHFLVRHGDWWHRGPGGRWVVKCQDAIAGFRASVPTVCFFQGAEVPAIWAMQLFVAPRFRGRGLQRLLDQPLLERAGLRMSFPNELGARIYVKQGYGLREDLQVLRAPLYPRQLQRVRSISGAPGLRRDYLTDSSCTSKPSSMRTS